jgi:hypothetical protein
MISFGILPGSSFLGFGVLGKDLIRLVGPLMLLKLLGLSVLRRDTMIVSWDLICV